MTRPLLLSAPAILVVFAGCQTGEEIQAGSAAPAPATASAQSAATASAMETSLLDTIIDEITEANTGTDVDIAKGKAVAPTSADPEPFMFSESGSITIDLDAPGTDDPDLSGVIRIDYSGAVVVSAPLNVSGTADYHVTVTWITDGLHLDPHCGRSTTVAAGSTWNVDAVFDWEWFSETAWTVAAVTDLDIPEATPHLATVTKGSDTVTVSTFGHRHEEATVTRAGSTWTINRDVVSDWFSEISGSFGDHSVHWDRDGLDEIRIVIDGVTYGPYTRWQVAAGWQCQVE